MNLAWIDVAGIRHSITAPDDAPPARTAERLRRMAHSAIDVGDHVGATVLVTAATAYRLEAERLTVPTHATGLG